jgi:hypothetical protein
MFPNQSWEHWSGTIPIFHTQKTAGILDEIYRFRLESPHLEQLMEALSLVIFDVSPYCSPYCWLYNYIPSGWWFGTLYIFAYIGNNEIIIPTDDLIFFRGVGIPPTRFGDFFGQESLFCEVSKI